MQASPASPAPPRSPTSDRCGRGPSARRSSSTSMDRMWLCFGAAVTFSSERPPTLWRKLRRTSTKIQQRWRLLWTSSLCQQWMPQEYTHSQNSLIAVVPAHRLSRYASAALCVDCTSLSRTLSQRSPLQKGRSSCPPDWRVHWNGRRNSSYHAPSTATTSAFGRLWLSRELATPAETATPWASLWTTYGFRSWLRCYLRLRQQHQKTPFVKLRRPWSIKRT
mmetsp:Transcript_206/g.465  ORF Transcript_206/g.465 Transcript_206/m.465 type:complete len:221 (+) Transcript_206:1467-2129(+)